MIRISEWLANPIGKDAEGEWIEFQNTGDKTISLSGWRLTVKSGKTYFLGNKNLTTGEYHVLRRKDGGFTLRNSDEELALYSPQGELAQKLSFMGTIPENKSVVVDGKTVLLGNPTPGQDNVFLATVSNPQYQTGVALNPPLASSAFAGIMLGVAAGITALIFYAVKSDDALSNIFFPSDPKTWSGRGEKDIKTPFNF